MDSWVWAPYKINYKDKDDVAADTLENGLEKIIANSTIGKVSIIKCLNILIKSNISKMILYSKISQKPNMHHNIIFYNY